MCSSSEEEKQQTGIKMMRRKEGYARLGEEIQEREYSS